MVWIGGMRNKKKKLRIISKIRDSAKKIWILIQIETISISKDKSHYSDRI